MRSIPSRRASEKLIEEGRVTVNGIIEDLNAELFIGQLLLVQHMPGVPAQHVGGNGQHRDQNHCGQ